MAMTRIRLFGRLSARCDDRSLIVLETGKAAALFSYLILHRGRAHSREALASLFWGEEPAPRALKNLRQTLWRLQSVLDQHAGECRGQIVSVEADWVRFTPGANVDLDVAVFEQAFTRVEGKAGEALDAADQEALDEAARLYTGDLLEECYEDWCILERARFQAMYLTMLDKLTASCEAHREYERGIVYARQILRFDRASERAHRRLMRLSYLAGDRTAALRQYDACVTALAEELGVKPARSTTALHEQIRADCLGPAIAPRGSGARSGPLGEIAARLHHLRGVLVEVDRQIQHDIRAIDETLHGPV